MLNETCDFSFYYGFLQYLQNHWAAFLRGSSEQFIIDEMINRSKGNNDYTDSAVLLQ